MADEKVGRSGVTGSAIITTGLLGALLGQYLMLASIWYVNPKLLYFNHYPRCVEDDGTVVIMYSFVFTVFGIPPFETRLELGEADEIHGCEVTGFEDIEDDQYKVTLFLENSGTEVEYTTDACH